MAKVNVYLPDDLERSVKEVGVPLSSVCQVALRAAVDRIGSLRTAPDPLAAMAPVTPKLAEVLGSVPAPPGGADGLAGPLELLGAVILHGENAGARVLRDLGVELPDAPARRRRSARSAKGFTDEARSVLAGAVRTALELRQERVGTEHLVLALAADDEAGALFEALGLDERAVRARLERIERLEGDERAAPTAPKPELLDRIEAELARLGEELRQLRRD